MRELELKCKSDGGIFPIEMVHDLSWLEVGELQAFYLPRDGALGKKGPCDITLDIDNLLNTSIKMKSPFDLLDNHLLLQMICAQSSVFLSSFPEKIGLM